MVKIKHGHERNVDFAARVRLGHCGGIHHVAIGHWLLATVTVTLWLEHHCVHQHVCCLLVSKSPYPAYIDALSTSFIAHIA
jgi:hypothetical protein